MWVSFFFMTGNSQFRIFVPSSFSRLTFYFFRFSSHFHNFSFSHFRFISRLTTSLSNSQNSIYVVLLHRIIQPSKISINKQSASLTSFYVVVNILQTAKSPGYQSDNLEQYNIISLYCSKLSL